DEAVALISREGKASTSFIQRHLQIGYNRAARIIEQMETEGLVSPANRVGRREVLVGRNS
ncbi:MAG: DNA translocase FtsK, partial [Rhodospirillales bacterium]|nr:DNA translocase FtsK [Rhodospirillales bacterium]